MRDSAFAEALAAGVLLGPVEAKVRIVEFGDLECPACRALHTTLAPLLKEYPNEVSLTFVHFPLSQHRFAIPAARGAQCAAAEGKFYEFVNAVYERQDSLGLKSFGSYAIDAGIRDTVRWGRCTVRPEIPSIVSRGQALGRRMQISGTPTVLINGWRYLRTPSGEELREAITRVRVGKEPVI